MAKRKWIFLSNTFEVQTRGSSGKMLSLAGKTRNVLSAERSDPVIDGIFNSFDPVNLAYQQVCANYDVAAGEREGNTLNVEILLLETLQTEIRKWEAGVYVVYVEDSPEAASLFPNKRTPFFHGTYEERINSIGALVKALQGDPLLSVVSIQAESFYNMVLSARGRQIQKKGLLGALSDLRERQRVLTAEALWGMVLGRLIERYRSDPSQIERFFDFTLLRKRKKKEEDSEEELLKAA